MDDFLHLFRIGLQTTSALEWTAILSGLIYIVMVIREKAIAWPFGIISSAFYTAINIDFKYYMDALLQLYYCVIGVYGWMLWSRKRNNSSGTLQIQRTSLRQWISLFIIGCSASIVLGLAAHYYTDSTRPFLDATLTAFSFIATWMAARKLYENWLLWISIDLGYVVLYGSRPAPFTSVLYLIYTLAAILGFYQWRKRIHLSNGSL
jgi:nicotinamide mononucleotide transporter